MKEIWKPGTMLNPLPVVLVSCAHEGVSNLITVAWTGTVCTNPPMLYISVRPERFSYGLIKASGEFTVNLVTEALARATDWCGVRSGCDHDKWKVCGLTPEPGVEVRCPSVKESPLSIECRVRSVTSLGSHDMFLADVVAVLADGSYIDSATGRFDLARAGLVSYSHGHYYGLGPELGRFGFSVMKKKKINNPS